MRFTKGIIDNDAIPNDKSIPPITPLKKYNYEKPVIVLGGLIDDGLKFENISTTLGSGNLGTTTINGETFYTLDVGTDLTPYINTSPPQTVLYGKETIRTLITNQLTDLTGLNSEIYAVIYGSPSTKFII